MQVELQHSGTRNVQDEELRWHEGGMGLRDWVGVIVRVSAHSLGHVQSVRSENDHVGVQEESCMSFVWA